MVYAIVRVRGTVNIKPDIKKTMRLLRLTRANHCVVVPETPTFKGMLQIAKDYVTWGEIDTQTMADLLEKRGKLKGDKPLTNEHISAVTSQKSIPELAEALIQQKIAMTEIPDMKPVFRLHPPRKGYEGIKRSFVNQGALGYRGKEINTLLSKML